VAVNIVEILVRSKDMTKEGFAQAEASTTSLGNKLSKIGMMAGAGLAVVGVEATKMAINFNAEMMKLGTQAGVSQNKIAGLKQGVLALAGQVGFSPDSLSASLFHVASNMESMGGTSKQMLDVVRVAAEGAKVGGADLVDVTNALTSAVASGIPGVQNYSQAMGILNAVVGTGDMNMQNLAEALGTGMVSVVKGYGLSIKDVGAALATFGDLNVRGAYAATLVRTAVQAMAVPAKTGAKELANLGMTSSTLAKDMQSGGMMKALEDLSARFHKAGISGTSMGAAITQMFGKKAGPGLAILLENMDRLRSKYPQLTQAANGFGKAWATTNSGLKQQLADLKGGFDALMVSIGEKLIPVVQSVVSWMLKNKQTVMDMLAGLGILAGVLLTVAVGIKTVHAAMMIWTAITKVWAAVTKVAAAAQWLLNIAMDANPIGLIIIAVAALIAIIVLVTLHFKGFRVFWIAVWHDIEIAAEAAWKFITSRVTSQVNQIRAVLSWFGHLGALFYGWWMAAYHAVANAASSINSLVRSIPGRILSALGNLGNLLWNAGTAMIHGLINGIESAIPGLSSVVSGIGGLIASLKGPLPKDLQLLVPHGKAIITGLMTGMTSKMPALRSLTGTIAPAIAGSAGGVSGGVAGPPGGHFTFEFLGGGDQDIMTAIRKNIRVRGGLTKALGP
jgi:TP901 family phage tail tape measure protein